MRLVEEVVSSAVRLFRARAMTATQNGCDALSMITPLFKHHGFSEEKEWRLVFMPQFGGWRRFH
jgi:hypothetical protein